MAAPKVTKVIQAENSPPVEGPGGTPPLPAQTEVPPPPPSEVLVEKGLKPTPPAPPQNPFITLDKWQQGKTTGTIRGMEVPGGCLVKSGFVHESGQMGESLCFVPNVRIVNGGLVAL